MKPPDNTPFPMVPAGEFLEMMGNDAGVAAEILDLALKECGAQLEGVRALRTNHGTGEAARALHSLRGSSATFRASLLVDLAREMESACDAGDADAALGKLPDFELAVARYRDGLRRMLEKMRERIQEGNQD